MADIASALLHMAGGPRGLGIRSRPVSERDRAKLPERFVNEARAKAEAKRVRKAKKV